MLISILIPVIRPVKAERAVLLALNNAGIPREEIEVLTEEDTERIGCPKMVKKLVEKSSSDLVVFLGDDSLPTINWLKNALEDMEKLPDGWGLVGLNDETGRTLATHWIADKRLLPIIGGEFFHTGYTHCCCDLELQERCTQLGRYIYSEKAVVMHEHPILCREPYEEWDEDYKRVYHPSVRNLDRELFQNRKKHGWETVK